MAPKVILTTAVLLFILTKSFGQSEGDFNRYYNLPYYTSDMKIIQGAKEYSEETHSLVSKFGSFEKSKKLEFCSYKNNIFSITTNNGKTGHELEDDGANTFTSRTFSYKSTDNPYLGIETIDINSLKSSNLTEKQKFKHFTDNQGQNISQADIYNSEGNLQRFNQIHYYGDNKIKSINSFKADGKSTYNYTYQYDNNNRLASINGGAFNNTFTFEYNSQGDAIKKQNSSVEDYYYSYKYDYDSHGSWIKKTTYRVSQYGVESPECITERKITY
jgi:hypothetical protein